VAFDDASARGISEIYKNVPNAKWTVSASRQSMEAVRQMSAWTSVCSSAFPSDRLVRLVKLTVDETFASCVTHISLIAHRDI
jgi:hypothetical protein